MYPPPDKKALRRLRGSVLDWITVYRYQFMLRFENANELMVRTPICFGSAAEVQTQEWIDFPLREVPMVRALDTSVTDAYSDENNNLWVEFSCGDVLVVAWAPIYESYELRVDGDDFLV